MKLDMFSTILVCAALESALDVARLDNVVRVLVEALEGNIPHHGHDPRQCPVRCQAWLRLLLALLHDPQVATLLEVPDTPLCVDLVDPQALLVVPSEGSAVACLLLVNVHVDTNAVSLINPIGSWPHSGCPGSGA
jgi:hypothetical protein